MIHEDILDYIEAELKKALIDNVPEDDPARAGIVTQGDLQGDPDPDAARISVTLHENDPDTILNVSGTTGFTGSWEDEVAETEIGGAVTWNRRFTVKARYLFINTKEDKAGAQRIARTVRERIERALLNMTFIGVGTPEEYVSRCVASETLKGEMLQAGGPPDAFDYFIKVRFDIQTTTGA